MSYYTLFYLISLLDRLSEMALSIFIFSALIILGWLLFSFMANTIEERAAIKKPPKKLFIIPIVFLLLFVFTPSKKDALFIIAGGSIAEFVENNETVKELPNDVIEYFKRELADPKK